MRVLYVPVDWTSFNYLRILCEHGTERFFSITGGEFHDLLIKTWLHALVTYAVLFHGMVTL